MRAARTMVFLVVAWLVVAGGVWSPVCLADGKGFISAVRNVPTPDQRVVVVFDGSRQTLIVDTTLGTSEREAAWVVPLPPAPAGHEKSVAKIEEVGRGFFKTLEVVFAPRVATRWGAVMWVVPGVLLLVVVALTGKGTWRETAIAVLAVVVALFLLLPSLSRARSSTVNMPGSDGGVDVLSSGRVGVFDSAVIRGDSGVSVAAWLRERGFHVPEAAERVMGDYAKEGWSFAAMRVGAAGETPAGTDALRPHPLAFTFDTDRAVYPLRLTGVQGESCRVRLWVFGDKRAEVAGLREVLSARVGDPDMSRGDGAWRVFENRGVSRWIRGASVLTLLEGELTPAQMAKDAWVGWRDFGGGCEWWVCSSDYAVWRGVDLAVTLALSGSIVVILARNFRRKWLRRFGVAMVVAAIPVGTASFAFADVVETWRVSLRSDTEYLAHKAVEAWSANPALACELNAAVLRGRIEALAAEEFASHGFPENGLSYGDGPGEFEVLCEDDRLIVVCYHETGHQRVIEAK